MEHAKYVKIRVCVGFRNSMDILETREIFYPDGNRTSFRQAQGLKICQLRCPGCNVWLNMKVQIKSQDNKLLPTSTPSRQNSCHTIRNVNVPEKFLLTSLLQFYAKSPCQSHTRFGTLIVATIYIQLIQNRYLFRSFTVLHCSHQHCVKPVASDVEFVG